MIFGEIIQLRENEGFEDYAYLCSWPEGEAVYLAKIPDVVLSQQLLQLHGKRSIQPSSTNNLRAQSSSIYFYVQLETKDFENRLMMLTSPEYPETKLQAYSRSLKMMSDEDIEKIKREILVAPRSVIPPKLREYVEQIGKIE